MELRDFFPFDNWIKKEQMIIGGLYFYKARNFEYGVWNGNDFEYERTKFGVKFRDHEYHWDEGSPHGTVKPLKLIE